MQPRPPSLRSQSYIPANYHTPKFPSVYQPLGTNAQYLYYLNDICRFTIFWTLAIYGAFHVVASGYAFCLQVKNWKVMWIVPIVYCAVAAIEAVLAGSVVGLMYVISPPPSPSKWYAFKGGCFLLIFVFLKNRLGAIYKAGGFRMSTWIPFLWGCINVLVLILSSFSIQGGL